MRVEFHQGVPPGCIEWLWNNVDLGIIVLKDKDIRAIKENKFDLGRVS